MSLENEDKTPRSLHLVLSWASLLSGGLRDCVTVDDESCEGGVAAVAAYTRLNAGDEPVLVLPFADRQSPFVQMHPLSWSVNRLVLEEIFGFKVYSAPPSLLTQHKGDFSVSQRDLSWMQSEEFPLLLTNVAIPPSITWSQYQVPVYFDDTTGLALMMNVNSGQPMNWPHVESSIGMLNYIQSVNRKNGCSDDGDLNLYQSYVNNSQPSGRCWIPVAVFADTREEYASFKSKLLSHDYPPQILIDVEGNDPSFIVPRKIERTWVVSFSFDDDENFHHAIQTDGRGRVTRVRLKIDDLEQLDETLKDEKYASQIAALSELAAEASVNNPVIGQSSFMPYTREGNIRRCKGGECEIGNLFTDAFLWYADADIAFTGSGGLRGSGWEAGGVRVSNIWDSLPFPNNLCTGVMNGVSIFKMFNYSFNVATFESENTSDGDRLLQIAGMRITFNKEMEGKRLVDIEIYDRDAEDFKPINRLKLYKFATDSFICGGFDPYPSFVGDELVSVGEVPGRVSDALLVQTIVGDYLGSLDEPYKAEIGYRMMNDTSATIPLNLIQNEEDCPAGTFWRKEVATCEQCPDRIDVRFLSEQLEFDAVEGTSEIIQGEISMVNGENSSVTVLPKSKPAWLEYSQATFSSTGNSTNLFDGAQISLPPLQAIKYTFRARPGDLEAGTAQGTVAFGVLDGGNFLGCSGSDATFEVLMRVTPVEELNHLGGMRYLGFCLAAVSAFISLFLCCWTWYYRNLRIVKTLQPVFLMTICVGMLVMSLGLVPLSIDDGFASERWCDFACMAYPWLLSMGFIGAMSALFSKLWRINKLFGATVRRMKVSERDVMAPFAIMFTLNATLLLIWTILDPLRWVRIEVENESWNTYGVCRSNPDGSQGVVAFTMMCLVVGVNLIALIVAGKQAYQARNISDEFSESKNMGIALFSWFQLMIVGFPVLYLIDEDNPVARYFLQTLLVFAIATSMNLLIFIPMIMQAYKVRKSEGRYGTDSNPASRQAPPVSQFSVRQMGTTRVSGLDVSNISDDVVELDSLPFNDENPNSDLDHVSVETDEDVGSKPRRASNFASQLAMLPETSEEYVGSASLKMSGKGTTIMLSTYDESMELPDGSIRASSSGEQRAIEALRRSRSLDPPRLGSSFKGFEQDGGGKAGGVAAGKGNGLDSPEPLGLDSLRRSTSLDTAQLSASFAAGNISTKNLYELHMKQKRSVLGLISDDEEEDESHDNAQSVALQMKQQGGHTRSSNKSVPSTAAESMSEGETMHVHHEAEGRSSTFGSVNELSGRRSNLQAKKRELEKKKATILKQS